MSGGLTGLCLYIYLDDFVCLVTSPDIAYMAAALRQALTAGMASEGVRMILRAALTSDFPHFPIGLDRRCASRATRTSRR